MAYPFPAVDTARTSERLSAFMAEILESKPVDIFFENFPTIDFLYKKKRMLDGGGQFIFPVGTGESPNNIWARDYDIIPTAGSDNARTVVYNPVQIFDAAVISWAEMREIAGSNHKIFDRVDFQRSNIMKTTIKKLNEGLYAAAQASDQITALPVAIDSTGTCGNLSQATEAQWASYEIDHSSADYTVGGYNNMLLMWEQLKVRKSTPDVIFTTLTLHRKYESEKDSDVRYSGDGMGVMGRGASELLFKRVPIIADADCTANTMYFLDSAMMPLYVDTEGDMKFDEFQKPDNQKAFVSTFAFRGQECVLNRWGQGKIIDIV